MAFDAQVYIFLSYNTASTHGDKNMNNHVAAFLEEFYRGALVALIDNPENSCCTSRVPL